MKYLELANQNNPIVLRIKERIIGSNPRLFGKLYKLRTAPYPTIDVKVLMPLKSQIHSTRVDESKVNQAAPMYKTSLSPVPGGTHNAPRQPRSVIPANPQRPGGMFVPNPHVMDNAPPKTEPIVQPPVNPPRPTPPPIGHKNVFRPPIYQNRPMYEAPEYLPPTSTSYPPPSSSHYQPSASSPYRPPAPVSYKPPVTESMPRPIPTPPQFRAPVVRPFTKSTEVARPFPTPTYEPRPVPGIPSPGITNPVPSSGEYGSPGAKTFAPPPIAPPKVSYPRAAGPPKKSILEQANFGITPMQKEDDTTQDNEQIDLNSISPENSDIVQFFSQELNTLSHVDVSILVNTTSKTQRE